MIVLKSIGALFVVMAFFSVGAVLGSRKKPDFGPVPGALDVLAIVLDWLAVLAAVYWGFKILAANAVAASAGLIVAFALHRLKIIRGDSAHAPLSPAKIMVTGGESSRDIHSPQGGGFRKGWRRFAQEMGGYQSRVILGAFYFVVILPFGIVMSGFADPLKVKALPHESFWNAREVGEETLEGARRQSS